MVCVRAARADRWTRSRGGRDTRAAPRARRAGARACRFVWPRCGSAGAEVPYGFTALVPTGAVGRALHARLAGDHGPCAHTRGTHTAHTRLGSHETRPQQPPARPAPGPPSPSSIVAPTGAPPSPRTGHVVPRFTQDRCKKEEYQHSQHTAIRTCASDVL